MKLFFSVVLFLLINSNPLNAQDSLLVELFQSNSYPLQFEGNKLFGVGIDVLEKEASKASFFLIGESHGMAETPLFAAALFENFKKHDYKYFATETGPYTAAILQDAAGKELEIELQSLFKEYPSSIPFFNWKEEASILKTVMAGRKNSTAKVIWGLDQEFAASFRMHFKNLSALAATPLSKAIAIEYHDKAVTAYKESAATQNPAKSFMAVVRPADFEKLKKAFVGQAENLKRIKTLEESIQIYQLWFQREGYQSNLQRAAMMKRYFMDYYKAANKDNPNPKVMFKFGANHMYRGANPLNIFDIGNFISELASQKGTTSFHLLALGRKGTQNGYNPFSKSEEDKKLRYDATKSFDKINLSTLLEATADDQWFIVDLRPLRKELFNHRLKGVQSGLEKLIWSYDAILLMPEVTASTNYD